MILHNHALFKRRAAPFERKKDRKTACSGPSSGRSASPPPAVLRPLFRPPPKESPSPLLPRRNIAVHKKLRRPTKRMSGSGAETTAQADSESAGKHQERQQLPSRPQAPAETPVMEAPEASAAAILASTSSKGA